MLKFLRGYEKFFGVAVFIMFVASFFEVFQLGLFVPLIDIVFTQKKIEIPNQHLPEFIYKVQDYLNSLEPSQFFIPLIGFVIFIFLIKNILIYIYSFMMSDISQRVTRDVRFKLYEKIQNLSLDYFSKKKTGELVSRITFDANIIENAVSYGLIDLVRQPFIILFCILTAFAIYPLGALIIFVIFPPIGYPLSLIGKRLKKISAGTQEKMAHINSHLLETISGIRIVKAFCTEDYEVDRFRGQNWQLYKLKMKAVKRMISINPVTEIFGVICGCVILWLLGKKVLAHDLSFGIFGLFMGSIMTIISPIKKMGNVNAIIQQALAANERIYEVLDMQPSVREAEGALAIPEIKKNLVLNDVRFHYDQESGDVLKDINLEIKKGELVAIVGPTGMGKTTLVNLLPRFYDPNVGSVTMDGINLKDVTFKSLRKQFGIVTQETILFNDTVKANISYGQKDTPQEDIEQAARRAFAYRFIMQMPQGYDTVIGDRGFRLSGGEKQRLAIARAILKNPPILILDEATSQLDSESEKIIQEALDELMKGRTVIAIAHRLSTVIKADKIVVLDKGKIIGLGKHQELLKTCALYEKLHAMQFNM